MESTFEAEGVDSSCNHEDHIVVALRRGRIEEEAAVLHPVFLHETVHDLTVEELDPRKCAGSGLTYRRADMDLGLATARFLEKENGLEIGNVDLDGFAVIGRWLGKAWRMLQPWKYRSSEG